MPKRVLYVHFHPTLGGAGISLLGLIKHLDLSRFSPHVLNTSRAGGEVISIFQSMQIEADHFLVDLVWDHPWLSLSNLRSRAWKAFRVNKQVRRYLEVLQPDIVNRTDFVLTAVGITASQMGIPVIWHCRHILTHKRPLVDPGRAIIGAMMKYARHIIAISESEAAQFVSDKTMVIYNPLETDRWAKVRGSGPAMRKGLGIGPDEFVVTAPIPLVDDKGAFDFIEACGVAKGLAPNLKMRFIVVGMIPSPMRRHRLRQWTLGLGPESEVDRAHRLSREWDVEDQLILTGFRTDVDTIMDASDLIVFPSHLRACGRACFEAGALGKPILVTLPNKDTRIVLDNETGLILPEKQPHVLGEAIAHLAQNPAEVTRLGQGGFNFVPRTFDARQHAQQVMDLYELACGT